MADETIIAGNPEVLRMRFVRDGCKVTATALDIGEMPVTHYKDGYTIQRCSTTQAITIVTGNTLNINPHGKPNPYEGAGSQTYNNEAVAEVSMHGLAAAVNEMGRVHAPKGETVTITMVDGSEFVGRVGDDRWVDLPVGQVPQFSIRDNCEARMHRFGQHGNPAPATKMPWDHEWTMSIRPTEGRAWSDIITPQQKPDPDYALTAEPQPECPAPYAETDGDFAIRILLTRVAVKFDLHGAAIQLSTHDPLHHADAIRLATLIGGAA